MKIINMNEDKALFGLNFQIEEYNKDALYIYGANNNYANLDNCHYNSKEITC